MGRKAENVVPENPRSYIKKEKWSTTANTTEKPSEVRTKTLLLSSTSVGFKSSFRIVRTMALLETRKQKGRKWWQGEDGSKKPFCVSVSHEIVWQPERKCVQKEFWFYF